ncbi:uncharacterized protein H6S33_001055 [Morchella sextelata]|uniref:uncharacterized protein n=1 Tax=Morchella sextelata TaxID=1174677 RepID=UPI001D053EFD|nr:uncharacterized protein H6S33_001055 [Morchella sextelata]KAH0608827.1 hypothetical protein H6S33_001055 [Morchella sextelata]
MLPARAPLTRAASSSSATSHQSGTIKEHWNDLPSHMVTPPSRSLTSTPLSVPPGNEEDDEEEFPALLKALFVSTPTTLPERERKLLHEKVVKSLSTITAPQKREVAQIIKRLVIERSLGKKEAKEAVVAFIMRERGVVGWAGGVRKGVESVILDTEA